MKVAYTVAARQIELVDLPSSTSKVGTALIAVESVGLCGTDHHIWTGEYPPSKFPLVQGHEITGILLESPGDGRLKSHIGERVVVDPTTSCGICYACRKGSPQVCETMEVLGVHRDGGLCEFLEVFTRKVHPIGDISADLGVLVEPASISLEAVRRANPQPGEVAVVVGAGPIGLWAVADLVDKGARVAVLEPNPWRRSLALAAGAELALTGSTGEDRETLEQWSRGDGPGLFIEASGAADSFKVCLELVRNAGVIVVVGVCSHDAPLPTISIPYKGLDIRGSRNSKILFSDAASFVKRHEPLASSLLTHRFSLEHIDDAFVLLNDIDIDSRVGKVVVQVQ